MPKIIASDDFRRQYSGLFRQELAIQKLRRVTNKDIESSLNIGQFGSHKALNILHFTLFSLYEI